MGKNPSFPFYPSDWTRDLDDLDLEIEGAWIRIICRLWWSPVRGEMTKSLKEFARILRKTEQKTIKILQILLEKGIASGSILDNQNITIINRRMKEYDRISQLRHEVGKKGGNPKLLKNENILDNQNPNQKGVPSSSSSSSSLKDKKPFVAKRQKRIAPEIDFDAEILKVKSNFQNGLLTSVESFVSLAASVNKTGKITQGRELSLLCQLVDALTVMGTDKFKHGLNIVLDKQIPNVNYLKKAGENLQSGGEWFV